MDAATIIIFLLQSHSQPFNILIFVVAFLFFFVLTHLILILVCFYFFFALSSSLPFFLSHFFSFFFYLCFLSEDNSDVLHFDHKQYRQSMVNLDSGNNCYYVDKNLLQITNTNSCEVIASSTGTGVANISTSCTNRNCRNNHNIFGESNKVKKNLSESCVIDATTKSSSTIPSPIVHKRK